jgi:hypothetical protein
VIASLEPTNQASALLSVVPVLPQMKSSPTCARAPVPWMTTVRRISTV